MSKKGDSFYTSGKYSIREEIWVYENWPLDRRYRSLNIGSLDTVFTVQMN